MTAPSIASRIYLTDSSNGRVTRSYVIFFITGNPGLVEYYRTFLTHLHILLNSHPTKSILFHVFGRSLSGFENNEAESQGAPFSLQEQIAHSHAALEEIVSQVKAEQKVEDVRVVLIGHSVGSYILLEILRRVRERATETGATHLRILGGVCLFPTVTHIAKSASGRKATPFLTLPFFVSFATMLAKAITVLLPFSVVYFFVRRIMGFPSDAAHVTATFVKSPHGVHEALYMARDEMLQITTDNWDAEIWGAAQPSSSNFGPPPKLRFLFAKEDHWVANETRDALIQARGKKAGDNTEEWRPVMEVDERQGWPHGFCIRHSVPVAERVGKYISEMVEGDTE